MTQYITTAQEPNRMPKLLFHVPLEDGSMVQMYIRTNNDFHSQNSAVILADTGRFLSLWRQGLDAVHATGGSTHWQVDRKLPAAQERFSQGEINPVQIPRAEFDEASMDLAVHDLSRTKWLLLRGCRFIPFECDLAVAAKLHGLIGMNGSSVVALPLLTRPPRRQDAQ